MSANFFDTNVLVYAAAKDPQKAERARNLMEAGGTISVQVLNEVTSVARRKMKLTWAETHDVLWLVRSLLHIEPVTIEVHERGLVLAERYKLSIYDSMIAACALRVGCDILYSEDMQDALLIEGKLRITNPFRVVT
jgi:predicted nucleic acid-binding protein